MKKSTSSFLIIAALYIPANPFYHFFSGNYYSAGEVRNIFAVLQFLAGIAAAFYVWFKYARKSSKKDK